jgi:hypothetical protein
LIVLTTAALSGPAWPQTATTSTTSESAVVFDRALPALPTLGFQSGVAVEGLRAFTMEFIGGEFGVAGKPVKNAPYSAEAVSETSQTLADGNRIRHNSSTRVYRDSQGRTRRESVLGVVGLGPEAELPRLVFISDPVAGFSYVLNLKERTATKTKIVAADQRLAALHARLAQGPSEDRHFEVRAGEGAAHAEMRTFTYTTRATKADSGKRETLPEQNIEGVIAEGSRTTFSIPAGQVGNERQIDIVSERWYSPELQTVVLTRQNDPRAGETTFRLTNISRSEPAASLFEVPPDFKLTEETGNVMRMRLAAPAAPAAPSKP